MQVKHLLSDDSAVSPVIGVILMVAITVILAAVIATFVLGLGEQVQDTAPSTSFQFDLDEQAEGDDDWVTPEPSGDVGMLEIRHSGGPNIDPADLHISGSSESDNPADWIVASESTVSAGDTVEIWISTDDTIDIVWQTDGESAILATYQGPDA